MGVAPPGTTRRLPAYRTWRASSAVDAAKQRAATARQAGRSWKGAVALTALLVSILVLVNQRRQRLFDEQRAHLDLEVNLLAEQKIAKLIGLVEEPRQAQPPARGGLTPACGS